MNADFYYYYQLTEKCRKLYKEMYHAIKTFQSNFTAKNYNYQKKDVDDVYYAIQYDNPQFFYLDQSCIQYRWNLKVIEIQLYYLLSQKESEKYAAIVNEKAGKILSYVKLDGKSDYEKVKGIHDILAGRIQYSYEWLGMNDGIEFLYAHSILGVFCQKRAVCEGIAKAYKMLINALGVKCILVSGDFVGDDGTKQKHAWNIVKIDEKTVHIDPTNDICNSTKEYISYDYFCLEDEQIKHTHTGYTEVPPCMTTSYDYFVRHNAEIKSWSQIDKIIHKEIQTVPGKIYIRLGYDLREPFTEVVGKIQKKIMDYVSNREGENLICNTKYNEAQQTVWIFVQIRV